MGEQVKFYAQVVLISVAVGIVTILVMLGAGKLYLNYRDNQSASSNSKAVVGTDDITIQSKEYTELSTPKTKAECIAAGYEKTVYDDEGNNVGRRICQNDGTTKIDSLVGEGSEAIYESANNCLIKGNISYNTGEKIYHVPGQSYYAATEINTSYGEKWFCSEQEAQAAGWRKAYQ